MIRGGVMKKSFFNKLLSSVMSLGVISASCSAHGVACAIDDKIDNNIWENQLEDSMNTDKLGSDPETFKTYLGTGFMDFVPVVGPALRCGTDEVGGGEQTAAVGSSIFSLTVSGAIYKFNYSHYDCLGLSTYEALKAVYALRKGEVLKDCFGRVYAFKDGDLYVGEKQLVTAERLKESIYPMLDNHVFDIVNHRDKLKKLNDCYYYDRDSTPVPEGYVEVADKIIEALDRQRKNYLIAIMLLALNNFGWLAYDVKKAMESY